VASSTDTLLLSMEAGRQTGVGNRYAFDTADVAFFLALQLDGMGPLYHQTYRAFRSEILSRKEFGERAEVCGANTGLHLLVWLKGRRAE
jgi:hypothetical protein